MIGQVQQAVVAEIQAAVERAEAQMAAMGAPLEMFDHLYAEMPSYLQLQKQQLAAELDEQEKGAGDG